MASPAGAFPAVGSVALPAEALLVVAVAASGEQVAATAVLGGASEVEGSAAGAETSEQVEEIGSAGKGRSAQHVPLAAADLAAADKSGSAGAPDIAWPVEGADRLAGCELAVFALVVAADVASAGPVVLAGSEVEMGRNPPSWGRSQRGGCISRECP